MRRRIFWAILAVVGVVLFLAGLASAVVGRSTARERIIGQLETTTEVVAGDLGDRPLVKAALRADDADAAAVILERGGRTSRLDDGTSITFGLLTDEFMAVVDSAGGLDVDPAVLRLGEVVHLDQRVGGEQVVAVVRPVQVDDSSSRILVIAARPLGRVRLGPVIRDLYVPLLVAALIAAIGARLAAGSIVKRLEDLRAVTGRLGSGDWAARASVDGGDEVAEVAATFNDLAAFLQETSERERSFLMSVSHELRTPLTTVAGYAELLASDPDRETSRIGMVLERETKRLRRLVEDVMLLAQLEARQFSVRFEAVDVAAHIGEVVDAFTPRAEEANIDVRVHLGTVGMVNTDPDRLAQVVTNLLDNGMRHTPERGELRIELDREVEHLVLTVTDSGPGVDPDEVGDLFERFYVGRRHERPEGSGLGLSIVRQLVAMLGGTVRAVLPATGGLTVEVRIPALEPAGSTDS